MDPTKPKKGLSIREERRAMLEYFVEGLTKEQRIKLLDIARGAGDVAIKQTEQKPVNAD